MVNEGAGAVELCVSVTQPDIDCPIGFSVTLQVLTIPDTAG